MEAIYVHQRGFCLHIIIGQLRLYTTGQTLLYRFPNASVFKPQQNLSGVQQKLLSGSHLLKINDLKKYKYVVSLPDGCVTVYSRVMKMMAKSKLLIL